MDHETGAPGARLLLLDTASLYFRAFFGMPEYQAPDGTNVNAVRGMLDYCSRLIEQYSPTHLVCCWDDDWRPQWRVDLIASYKAHRVVEEVPAAPDVEEVPDPLQVQVPIIRAVLEAFGIAVVGAPDYEADDVIGTLATDAGMAVDVVTGDRDLFQLVDDAARVRVLYVAKGVGRHDVVDEAWVQERYGVAAQRYADFATLRGDASDGLPGVRGVGDKTAAVLIERFGDLAGIRAAALDTTTSVKLLSAAQRAKILEAADYLDVAPTVVAVARDVPVDRSAARFEVPVRPADPDAVAELVRRWGLATPAERLTKVLADNEA